MPAHRCRLIAAGPSLPALHLDSLVHAQIEKVIDVVVTEGQAAEEGAVATAAELAREEEGAKDEETSEASTSEEAAEEEDSLRPSTSEE